jgi:hypothetical protein
MPTYKLDANQLLNENPGPMDRVGFAAPGNTCRALKRFRAKACPGLDPEGERSSSRGGNRFA